MPSQPPEETSVLSHQSVQDADPGLAVRTKDTLALYSSEQLGRMGRTHRASLPVSYSMMVQPQQQQQAHRYHSQHDTHLGHTRKSSSNSFRHVSGHVIEALSVDQSAAKFSRYDSGRPLASQSIANGAVVNHTAHVGQADLYQNPAELNDSAEARLGTTESYTTSTTMSANGLQLRKAMHYNSPHLGLPSPLSPYKSIPQLPTPSITSMGLTEPIHKSDASDRKRYDHSSDYGHYSDQHYHRHLLYQQLYPPSSQDYDSPYSPQFSTSSPLSPNYPTETFHSAHASPSLQHREYYSPQSSPFDIASHYRDLCREVSPDAHAMKAPPSYALTNAQSSGLKSSPISLWKKVMWILFTMNIFLLPLAVLKTSFQLRISAGGWQTSVTYGMLMTVDFLSIIIFSTLNRHKVDQRVKKRDPHWVGLSTGILAVGYREDPVLLEGCLKSLRAIRYQRNHRVLLVVDGNEPQDEYMAQIFIRVFRKQGATVFRPNFLCMDRHASDKEREDLVRQVAYHPGPVCVMQPHRGKRCAMYTGFAALLQQELESVVVTDSDTYLDPGVCKELAFALAESPIIGAATGDVRIYNTGTWVSFLSSIWYWFAFNLERGAQSYHSVVNCVSGPLGIYRMSIVAEVMDSWVRQSFLGVFCTYGDDRHLTNLVLKEGFKVKFSQYAICYTDTPTGFITWVTQQTRWSKSFFREIPIQLGCFHLHSPWMTYSLIYQLICPMMMVYNFVNCIYFGTGSQFTWWMVSIILVGCMKTVFALRITGDKKFFFTTLYGPLYMIGYVPSKVYAALTLYDNTWGTSARLFRNFTQLQNYIAPMTWAAVLFFGLTRNPSRYSQFAPMPEDQAPPFLDDAMVLRALIVFGLGYLFSYLWFFQRTGIVTREYKRNFSYEELYENRSYINADFGSKRKVSRFEV
ncbi:hypothetical protein BC939DRAFT_112050 [Gamsiella multidivaricata]|uniref:uncharacterized protein n=1 Tax=Gamsiella multidivaricata TaxID=101098 RepID=UPI00222124E0|nr:uncharacterized protein BC939DRAFT_112050 [Gamsiella multidivaricata]KAG0370524.1 Hyaluronan synthase 3 [Gamsiella multidivaricata]KAI7826522.1 hypothetical protein BC939DRAFT_112050 [Gamsiella multidivaricata]